MHAPATWVRPPQSNGSPPPAPGIEQAGPTSESRAQASTATADRRRTVTSWLDGRQRVQGGIGRFIDGIGDVIRDGLGGIRSNEGRS